MKLVSGGSVKTVIVKPTGATPREEFAAGELQKYLRAVSGCEIPIISETEAAGRPVILIGGPERNKLTSAYISEADFDARAPGPEGMLIKTFAENALVLAGSSKNHGEHERGTIYAVYEFLERFLGCSFAAYGPPGSGLGEYIPSLSEIEITADYSKPCADLSYRTSITQLNGAGREINATGEHKLMPSFIDWLAKTRYNRILMMLDSYEVIKGNGMLDELIKRGISITAGHHDSSMFFLPTKGSKHFPVKYGESHPEYYRLQEDGTRYLTEDRWAGQFIFDTRNPDGIAEVARNINGWLDENPYVDKVALWPNDGVGPVCACEACRSHSLTTNYAFFVNEVAKKVGAKHPGVKIDLIVYVTMWDPPAGVELCPHVFVQESTAGLLTVCLKRRTKRRKSVACAIMFA